MILALLTLALLASTVDSSAVRSSEAALGRLAPTLWAGLLPGPFHVGYRKLDAAGGAVHTWYPAASGRSGIVFRDYLADDGKSLASFLAQTGVASSTIDSLLASPLYATQSAPPLDREAPLVLVAQGNGQDAADQAVLCEYLASQGFVVATTPSPMLRIPLEREDQVGVLAETQASELAAAIGMVSAAFRVDLKRLGVVGHSFGARAALLLAMRDPRVRAIVSLDGGIGTASAVEPFRRAQSFDAGARIPPLLHFYEELDPFMAPDFTLLRSLHMAKLQLEKTEGMHHAHFTTYGFAAAAFRGIAEVTHAAPSTARSLRDVTEQTAAFLGAAFARR